MIKLPPANVTMSHWNIVVITRGALKVEKFLGYCHESGDYRISSEIKKYDPVSRTGQTASGSTYTFLDEPGPLHPSAQFIFDSLNAWDEISVLLKFDENKR